MVICLDTWSLGLSCLGGNFIPKVLFAVCIFRECLLRFPHFTDLFGGDVQEGMLAHAESWQKSQPGNYDPNNPPGDLVRREVMLSLVFVQC